MAALRPRQRRALDAICDTFHPGTAGLGASDAFLELFGSQLRPAELRQLGWLLSLFGVRRFERLSEKRRERILLAWCNSRLVMRRAAFHGLRKAALALAYGLPGQDGAPNPTWERIGYPGPIGPVEEAPPKAIEPLAVTRDLELECDVCVVGSGAGGGRPLLVWPPRASTWSCSRPATTTTIGISTEPSFGATGATSATHPWPRATSRWGSSPARVSAEARS